MGDWEKGIIRRDEPSRLHFASSRKTATKSGPKRGPLGIEVIPTDGMKEAIFSRIPLPNAWAQSVADLCGVFFIPGELILECSILE